jgi:hypothetical protein
MINCIAIQLHLILRMQLVLAILFLVAILLQYNTISMHCQYIGGGQYIFTRHCYKPSRGTFIIFYISGNS